MSTQRAQRLVAPLAVPAPALKSHRWSLHVSERRILLMLGDIAMLSIALFLALWIRIPGVAAGYGWRGLFVVQLHWWLTLWGWWIPASIASGCYDLRRSSQGVKSAIYTAACALVICGLYFVTPAISAPLTHSRLSLFIMAMFAGLGVAGWRMGYALLCAQPTLARRALVVGAGCSGRALAEALDAIGASSGVELVGFVDDNLDLCGDLVAGHSVLAPSERLLELVGRLRVDDVVVAITDPSRIKPALLESLVRCWERGVAVIPMALYYEQVTGAVPVRHVGQNLFALVNGQNVIVLRLWGAVRRLLDLLAAAVGLLLLGPLIPLLALAITIDCPGPIFYRQRRVGRGGRIYHLTKFRSMIPDAEANGVRWAARNDDRITRVGRFMRKTRLDELPQLWNILVGDMSLIGPRPERPEFVDQLDDLLPFYAVRHSVRPGLTGWAQVRYRYGNSVEDALMKLQYDLYYVKHRGPVLDALIVLHTIRVVLAMQGN